MDEPRNVDDVLALPRVKQTESVGVYSGDRAKSGIVIQYVNPGGIDPWVNINVVSGMGFGWISIEDTNKVDDIITALEFYKQKMIEENNAG